MLDLLRTFLSDHMEGLTNNVFEEITAHFSIKSVKRNQTLIRPGELMRHLYFINSGCLRTYYLNMHDIEITSDLAFEGNFSAITPEFLLQKTGDHYIDALEKSDLLTITYGSFKHLALKYVGFQIGIFYIYYMRRQEVFSKYLLDDAATRYQWLKTSRPHIIARVPDKFIASYLGMSTRTLIRAKTAAK